MEDKKTGEMRWYNFSAWVVSVPLQSMKNSSGLGIRIT